MHLLRVLGISLLAFGLLGGCDTGTAAGDATVGSDAQDTSGTDEASGDSAETCENSCLDELGKSKKTLCPDPISDWNCKKGCCIPVFRCDSNSDCLEQGVAEEQCEGVGFDCRCDVGSGVCYDWYCGVDADCGDGLVCAGGKCADAPDVASLEIRFVTAQRVLSTGNSAVLQVEAYDPQNADMVVQADVSYESSDEAIVAVAADGLATGGASDGNATITAVLTADASKTATLLLRNVGITADDALVVIATKRGSIAPVTGRYALVDSSTGEALVMGDLPADGIVRAADMIPEGGLDVHVFGDESDWISVLGAQGGVLLLPGGAVSWAELEVAKDGSVNMDESQVDGMRVLSGLPDFSLYPKTGEFELSLNCFALSNALFDFSLDAILGRDVKRFFHPDTVLPGIDKTAPADMPGGITFGLGGPALPSYWQTSRPGNRLLWSLGGRVEMGEVAPIIGDVIDSISGDEEIDFGKLVSAIIPLFGSFWSGITTDVTLEAGDPADIVELNPLLRVPMGMKSSLTMPHLPAVGEDGWADALFLIGGAFTADGNMVPLGINAGADTIDSEADPADGIADSDHKTAEVDPFDVPLAMLHSGLGGPHTRYGIAAVAAIIRGNDDPRPEGGSAILEVAEPGHRLAPHITLPAFLGFPVGSTWDPETRELSVEEVSGADTQRLLFKGKKGADWIIWLRGRTSYTVPTASEYFADDESMVDRTENVRLALVNSFDFEEGVALDNILSGSSYTLDLLLKVTKRVSFIDVRP